MRPQAGTRILCGRFSQITGPTSRLSIDKYAERYGWPANPVDFAPGISASADKMLQGRLFSYGDTHRHPISKRSTVMNLRIPLFHTLRSACTAAGAVVGILAIASQPVYAQQVSRTSEATEEVKVTAPEVERIRVGQTSIGAPIEVISLSRPVSYGDLDLTRQSDANELEKRILDTAEAACKELDNMYPDGSLYQPIPSDQNCVKSATTEALKEAHLVIAAANHMAEQTAQK
jgi:UrcA family protein